MCGCEQWCVDVRRDTVYVLRWLSLNEIRWACNTTVVRNSQSAFWMRQYRVYIWKRKSIFKYRVCPAHFDSQHLFELWVVRMPCYIMNHMIWSPGIMFLETLAITHCHIKRLFHAVIWTPVVYFWPYVSPIPPFSMNNIMKWCIWIDSRDWKMSPNLCA